MLNQLRDYTAERMAGYATTIEEDNKVVRPRLPACMLLLPPLPLFRLTCLIFRDLCLQSNCWHCCNLELENCVQIGDDKAPPKKRVASKLLKLEKKILRNFLAAVDELINELPDGSDIPCQGVFPPILK